jgi:hypothetical protein
MEQAQYEEKPQEKLQFQPMLKTWAATRFVWPQPHGSHRLNMGNI